MTEKSELKRKSIQSVDYNTTNLYVVQILLGRIIF